MHLFNRRFIIPLSGIIQKKIGSLWSLVSVKGSSSCHLLSFFLLPLSHIIRELHLYLDFSKAALWQCLLLKSTRQIKLNRNELFMNSFLYDNVCIVVVAGTEDRADATCIKIDSACDHPVERKKGLNKQLMSFKRILIPQFSRKFQNPIIHLKLHKHLIMCHVITIMYCKGAMWDLL